MDKIIDGILNNWNQPQLFTLMVLVFLVFVISLILYFQIKKTKKDKAPSTTVYLAEQYFGIVDNLVTESAGSRLDKVKPYLFTLFTFLLLGNLLSMFGLEPVASSLSVTLTLGFISWSGIYIIALIFQKFRFFKKYINPLEIVSIPGPLISLSFRLFGNIIGGSTILLLLYYFFGWIWTTVTSSLGAAQLGILNLPAALLFPPFIFYFDLFDTLIQSYVFLLLTIMFWSSEAAEESKGKNKKVKKTKEKLLIKA